MDQGVIKIEERRERDGLRSNRTQKEKRKGWTKEQLERPR
jgi:hypothetical protein